MYPSVISDSASWSNPWNQNGFGGSFSDSVGYNPSGASYYISGTNNNQIGTWNPSQSQTGANGLTWYSGNFCGFDDAFLSIGSFPFSSISENDQVYWASYVSTGGYGSGIYSLQWVSAVYGLPNDVMPTVSPDPVVVVDPQPPTIPHEILYYAPENLTNTQ